MRWAMASGPRRIGATPMIPEDSIQHYVPKWWTTDDDHNLRRGRLLRAFVPHVDQEPLHLIAEGRADPTSHKQFTAKIERLDFGASRKAPALPVAALPHFQGEVHAVYRAKDRPVLVVSGGGPLVEKALRLGSARWQTAPTLIVAPYYGVDSSGTRGGWRPEFVERIRRGEYPQYIWDSLPLKSSTTTESILRLDHIQPIGRIATTHEWTPHCLSDDAMKVLDEWIDWLMKGSLSKEGLLDTARQFLVQEFSPSHNAP